LSLRFTFVALSRTLRRRQVSTRSMFASHQALRSTAYSMIMMMMYIYSVGCSNWLRRLRQHAAAVPAPYRHCRPHCN